jgi:arylsulfatase A-like enzyme
MLSDRRRTRRDARVATRLRAALLLLVLLLPAGLRAEAPASVILISLDGVRSDLLEDEQIPALRRVIREGARAEALVPVFPSLTFPNHVSMATGTWPDRHGIVANHFLDRERGEFDYSNEASWIQAEPLWVAAERQGVRAASFFWVGSETAWRGVAATHRVAPFDDTVGEADKVDRILAWLDLPEAERPRLVLSWWHGADGAGHRHGPDAPQVREALRGQDAELGRLLAGLEARGRLATTTLLVVSDHGMSEGREALNPFAALEARGIRARVILGSAVAFVHLERPAQAAAAIEALGGLPGVRALPGNALPREWRLSHPTRIGEVFVVADPPRLFTRPWTAPDARFRLSRLLGSAQGVHGYDPSAHPEMHGVFLAVGRGVPAGLRPGRVHAIDVAPTIARLLGIEPPRDSEGAAVPGIGGG